MRSKNNYKVYKSFDFIQVKYVNRQFRKVSKSCYSNSPKIFIFIY